MASTSALASQISHLHAPTDHKSPRLCSSLLCDKTSFNQEAIGLPALSWSARSPSHRRRLKHVYSLFEGKKENADKSDDSSGKLRVHATAEQQGERGFLPLKERIKLEEEGVWCNYSVQQKIGPISLNVSSCPPKTCFRALQLQRCCASSNSSSEASTSPSSRIFIKGLSQGTTEGVVAKAFSQYGKISRVKIVREKRTGESLGLAYVWFDSEESANIATEEMNGKFFGGRFVDVTIARPESPTSLVRAAPYKF